MNFLGKRFDTKQAAEYLTEKTGVNHSPGNIRNQRCKGEGAVCDWYGRRPVYTQESLDTYIEQNMQSHPPRLVKRNGGVPFAHESLEGSTASLPPIPLQNLTSRIPVTSNSKTQETGELLTEEPAKLLPDRRGSSTTRVSRYVKV